MLYTKNILVFVFLGGVIGWLIIVFMSMNDHRVLGWLLGLLWIAGWAIAMRLRDRTLINKIWLDASETCQPEKAVLEYKQILKHKKRRASHSALLILNLNSALISAGDDDEALAMMGRPEVTRTLSKESTRAVNQFVLDNNRMVAYMHMGRIEEAEQLLEQMKALMKDRVKDSLSFRNARPTMENTLMAKVVYLGILKGDIDGAERYLKTHIDSSTGLPRANSQYYLGLVYEKASRASEAKALFEEVAKSGGTSWVAKQSRIKLDA